MTYAEMRGCWLRLLFCPKTVEVIAHGEQAVETVSASWVP